MKTLQLFLGTICAILGLTSCFQSESPLSEPVASGSDESIKGVWHAIVDGDDSYLHIIPMKPPMLKLIRVTHVKVGGYHNLDELEMFPTIIGDKKFMNLKFLMPKDEKRKQSVYVPRYDFVKYELSADSVLSVWCLDREAWKKAIADKRIKGKAWSTTWMSNVHLNDTSKNLLGFLASKDIEKEFELLGKFRRVKVDKTPQK